MFHIFTEYSQHWSNGSSPLGFHIVQHLEIIHQNSVEGLRRTRTAHTLSCPRPSVLTQHEHFCLNPPTNEKHFPQISLHLHWEDLQYFGVPHNIICLYLIYQSLSYYFVEPLLIDSVSSISCIDTACDTLSCLFLFSFLSFMAAYPSICFVFLSVANLWRIWHFTTNRHFILLYTAFISVWNLKTTNVHHFIWKYLPTPKALMCSIIQVYHTLWTWPGRRRS